MHPEQDPRAAIAAAWLRSWASEVHARRTWLTDLDAAIGDGDHGINLDRGLTAVAADLDAGAVPVADAGTLIAAAGRRLMGLVGGASGALYGRALVRAGAAVTAAGGAVTATSEAPAAAGGAGVTDAGDRIASGTIDIARFPELVLTAAVESIAELGHAVPGDKTMLDALVPALEALRNGPPGEPVAVAVCRAAGAAESGARATIPLVARKGRASYLGDRSAGHLDPGAASSAMLVRCLADAIAGD